MINKISALADQIEDKIINIRRYLHAHPELSFCERDTMSYICRELESMGVEYSSNIAGTGIVVYLNGEKPSVDKKPKTLLFRADMDALPIDEVSEKPYKSQNRGAMHACGHDAHCAILLGVCKILSSLRKEFSGCVKLIFQPGEETSGGAKPMIDAGVLENPDVDVCVALHTDTDIDCGKIRIKPGPLYASPDDFSITVFGRGGHGAEPHNCTDPIAISACVISELMTLVSREIDPFEKAVVSIGTIHAGNATNVIPDKAEITGTARSLTNEIRALLKKRIGEIACGVCSAHGAKCEYKFRELFPPLINDEQIAATLYTSARRYIGEENCIFGGEATMAGEDFAYFTQKLPSVLFKLGCRNEAQGITEPLHSPKFDIDERALKCGMKVFAGFAIDMLG